MTKLEELKEAWEVALEAAVEEERSNQLKVVDFIQGLTDKKLNVRANIRDKSDSYISVDFVGPDGKDDFSSDFDISYRGRYDYDTHSYSDPEIAMDCGSSGLTTRKEQPFKVERCHLMSAIWNHEDELVEILKSFVFERAQAADEAKRLYYTEKHRVEQQAEDELKAKVLDTVKVGFTFSENNYVHRWNKALQKYEDVLDHKTALTITKITPKRVYLEWAWVENAEHAAYGKDSNGTYKYLGVDCGHVNYKDSGYMDLDKFIYYRTKQFKGEKQLIANNCNGQQRLLYEFVKESFTPAVEED